MKTRILFCLLLLTAAGAAGCATPSAGIESSTALTKDKRERIKQGMTRQDVISILGQPESKLTLDDGETLFFKDVNLSSMWVRLNREGKVDDWEWSE